MAILSFLDNESNSLSDKIKITILETHLQHTTSLCGSLMSGLQQAEENISSSNKMIQLLQKKVEVLDTRTSICR